MVTFRLNAHTESAAPPHDAYETGFLHSVDPPPEGRSACGYVDSEAPSPSGLTLSFSWVAGCVLITAARSTPSERPDCARDSAAPGWHDRHDRHGGREGASPSAVPCRAWDGA